MYSTFSESPRPAGDDRSSVILQSRRHNFRSGCAKFVDQDYQRPIINGSGFRIIQGFSFSSAETDLNPSGYERTVSGAYWHVEKTSRKVRVPLINLFTGWVYGPGSWFEATVKCLTNGVARIVGDGSNYLSLIHIDDLAMAYAMLVEKMPLGERYCLVDGNPITQAELAFYIASLAGTRKPKKVDLENYCRIAGDLAGESQSCSTRVSGTKMSKRLLPVLKFPDYRTGIPDALDRLSDGPGRERAERPLPDPLGALREQCSLVVAGDVGAGEPHCPGLGGEDAEGDAPVGGHLG